MFTDQASAGLKTLHELKALGEECRSINWGGYGAVPVTPETMDLARRLTLTIPPDLPLPSPGAEADGHLTLEWYGGHRRVLSLSISSEGFLYYAAHIGQSKRSGTEPFIGQFPEDVAQIVRLIFKK